MRWDYYVYVWTDASSGKQYVGKGVGRRALAHLEPKSKSLLSRAMRAHGTQNFSCLIVADQITEDMALGIEECLIDKLGTRAPKGYNICSEGRGAGGLRKTAEQIEKTASKLRGRKRPAETVERIRRANFGLKRSDEARANMSRAQTGVRRTNKRSLNSAQAVNVCLLKSLGATNKNIAVWMSCSVAPIKRLWREASADTCATPGQ